MTRYAIDAPVAVRLARDGVTVPAGHRLVAPHVLRSDVLSLLYRAVRAGELDERAATELLDRVTTTRVRLLGDRVSRARAWQLARTRGWAELGPAEYLAVASLQADALVTEDPDLAGAAEGIVPVAGFDELAGTARADGSTA